MSQSKYRQLDVRAPRGTTLTVKSCRPKSTMRMLMNNLDPDVAENPHELVVYGGTSAAQRATGNALLRRYREGAEEPGKLMSCWCSPAGGRIQNP